MAKRSAPSSVLFNALDRLEQMESSSGVNGHSDHPPWRSRQYVLLGLVNSLENEPWKGWPVEDVHHAMRHVTGLVCRWCVEMVTVHSGLTLLLALFQVTQDEDTTGALYVDCLMEIFDACLQRLNDFPLHAARSLTMQGVFLVDMDAEDNAPSGLEACVQALTLADKSRLSALGLDPPPSSLWPPREERLVDLERRILETFVWHLTADIDVALPGLESIVKSLCMLNHFAYERKVRRFNTLSRDFVRAALDAIPAGASPVGVLLLVSRFLLDERRPPLPYEFRNLSAVAGLAVTEADAQLQHGGRRYQIAIEALAMCTREINPKVPTPALIARHMPHVAPAHITLLLDLLHRLLYENLKSNSAQENDVFVAELMRTALFDAVFARLLLVLTDVGRDEMAQVTRDIARMAAVRVSVFQTEICVAFLLRLAAGMHLFIAQRTILQLFDHL